MRTKNNNNFLKAIKNKATNKTQVYGFDIETYHKNIHVKFKNRQEFGAIQQEFLMGSIVGDRLKKVFWDKQEMQEFLTSKQFNHAFIVATNLEFDFFQLFDDVSEFKLVYRNGLIMAVYDKDDTLIRFVDTLNYIHLSVENLGKLLGVPKLKKPSVFTIHNNDYFVRKPANERERQELIDYNVQDSRITYLFMETFKAFLKKHNAQLKATIGSVGLDFWRRNYQTRTLTQPPAYLLEMHFEGVFKGGITQVIKRGTANKKLWYYDYRSSYPSVLTTGIDTRGSFPFPSRLQFKDKIAESDITNYEGIVKVDVHKTYDYLPILSHKYIYNNQPKLLNPIGNFESWLTFAEIRAGFKHGYEFDFKQGIVYYETFKPFKSAVEELYALRKKYKLEKSPYQAMVKTLMNSGLYGKWGTNFMKMTDVKEIKNIVWGANGTPYHNKLPITDELIQSNNRYFVIKNYSTNPMRYSHPILSVYTTALGRLKLMNDIHKQSKHVYYMDTDSVIVDKKCLQDGDELGDFELEHVLDWALFIKPKFYAIHDINSQQYTTRFKGVGRAIKNITDFRTAIKTQQVTTRRFSKFRESIRHNIKSATIIDVVKRFGLEDNKRSWIKRFNIDELQDSEPLKLVEGLTQKHYLQEQDKAMQFFYKKQKSDFEKFKDSDLFDSEAYKDIDMEHYIEEMM